MNTPRRTIDDAALTSRLLDLHIHLNHLITIDRDDPQQIAAFKQALLRRSPTKPATPHPPKIRYALAALGLLAIVTGLSGPASPVGLLAPPTAHLATPSSQLFWQGPVTITENGLNFDTAPPSTATGISVSPTRPVTIHATEGALHPLAQSPKNVSKQTCTDAINTATSLIQLRETTPNHDLCFQTAGGKIGLLQFPNPTDYPLEAIAHIWN